MNSYVAITVYYSLFSAFVVRGATSFNAAIESARKECGGPPLLEIVLNADNDFYSQRQQVCVSNNLPSLSCFPLVNDATLFLDDSPKSPYQWGIAFYSSIFSTLYSRYLFMSSKYESKCFVAVIPLCILVIFSERWVYC